jgi:hypothetical protein
MKRWSVVGQPLVALLLAGRAFAHPGHAVEGAYPLLHYLTEPYHVLAALTALVAVGAAMVLPLMRERLSTRRRAAKR